jgi:SAM-dependent methyltransferase
MHQNSLNMMKAFRDKYLEDKNGALLNILDLGSRVVKGQEHFGSYRQFFNKLNWKYQGADVEEGSNVDIVLQDSYCWPWENNFYDVIISGQTLEHIEFPWAWMTELKRVLEHGGLCCVIAPAVIHEHRYPIDTYRYYPDGMKALAKWSGLEVIETYRTRDGKLEDTCLIATKR